MTEIAVRMASRDEIDWVNARYDEVAFKHSDYERELIAVAEVDGVRAGIGRLVRIGEAAAELGGIYVFEPYRGSGVAHRIIQYLMRHVRGVQRVFCIPFAHLGDLYRGLGFVDAVDCPDIPAAVEEKHRWCLKTYASETLLLVLENRRPA